MEDATGDTGTPTAVSASASGREPASGRQAASTTAAGATSTTADGATSVLRRLLTPRWIAFTLIMLAAVTACLLLARWQYERFESISGTWQNLGYTLQWPFFAAFAVYVWWRLLRDSVVPPQLAGRPAEHVPADGSGRAEGTRLPEDAGLAADGTTRPDGNGRPDGSAVSARTQPSRVHLDPHRSGAPATHPPAGNAVIVGQRESDDDDDAELAAYNEYLAALNRRSVT